VARQQVEKVAMRMNGRNAVLAGTLLVAVGGCSNIKDHRGYLVDPALTQSVLPGVDNRLSVERSLGQPTLKSQFGQQTWYYVSLDTTQKPFTLPRIYAGSIMRVSFDGAGNVQEVNNGGVEHAVRIKPDEHKTPTLGRERSFFEDLFGNIGTVGAMPGGGMGGGMGGPTGGGGGGGGGGSTGQGPNGS
jgi:outer membrane protein assembly factor BamE (lipoprotein component of BamABCDE complex)